jgi:hypothetical protein
MDNALWKEHLAKAEQAVADSERHIARQKELIAELERDGHSGQAARELLAQFESVQAVHIAHRNRLRRDLNLKNVG